MRPAEWLHAQAEKGMDDEHLKDVVKQVFRQQYEGTRFLEKAGGSEIRSPDFEVLVEELVDLVQRDNIKHTLVLGGGPYIDEAWQSRHKGERPKGKDGRNQTSRLVLDDAVIPGHGMMRARVQKLFLPYKDQLQLNFISPDDVLGERENPDEDDFVGKVQEIRGFDEDADINVVSFLGTDINNPNQRLNINADELFRHLAGVHAPSRAFIFTSTAGVLDMDDEVVPLLTQQSFARILNGEDPFVRVEGGMRRKLEEAQRVLDVLNQVTITSIRGLMQEVFDVRGSGTLAVRPDMHETLNIREEDYPIFLEIYRQNVKDGLFRDRSEDELAEVMRHHKFLKNDKALLGGYSLMPHGNQDVELACLWAGYLKNGVAQELLANAQHHAEVHAKHLWAVTSQRHVKKAFEQAGFEFAGHLADLVESGNPNLPGFIRDYNPEEIGRKSVYGFATAKQVQETPLRQRLRSHYSDDVDTDIAINS